MAFEILDSIPSTHVSDSLVELKVLSSIIAKSIWQIENALSSQHLVFPSLSTPFTFESEAPRNQPDVARSVSELVAAAYQLIATARSPVSTVPVIATQYTLSTALGIVTRAHVAEICREAGSSGAHVKEIAQVTNLDSAKLARILRLLATNHIFTEIAPDVFVNNRISSVLDSGKSVVDLVDKPGEKHVGTLGIAALVGHCADEGVKSGGYLEDVLFDTKLGKSEEVNETALNVAFNTPLSGWEWLESKDNVHRLHRLAIAMEGSKNATPPDAILGGFDWKGLSDGSLIVDVGGGLGAQSLILAKTYSHLRFVIQDRELVIKDSIQFWDRELAGARESGRVDHQVHDFFNPQPHKDADVFLVRQILHDWTDKYCVQILRNLRASAKPTTQLVVIDNLMSHTCPEESADLIPGAKRLAPPKPLLANLGHASSFEYQTDIHMLGVLNGVERTVSEIDSLMQQTGWKLVRVDHGKSAFATQKAIGVPI